MLNVTIRSLQRALLERWITSVRLPGAAGEFEVLGFHVPFMAALTAGKLWIENQKGVSPLFEVLPIRGGLAWLASDRLIILVEETRPR